MLLTFSTTGDRGAAAPPGLQVSESPGLPLPGARGPPFPEALAARRLHLTAREVQVMRGIWEGRKYTAIASDLGISRHTVETHARHIKAKLAAPSLVHAIHRIYAVLIEEEVARIRAAEESQRREPPGAAEGGEGSDKR